MFPPPNYNPDYGTGYRVTFEDFRYLLTYPPYRRVIEPLLKQWFGEEVGSDLKSLHERTQADPRMQFELYQAAMTLWH